MFSNIRKSTYHKLTYFNAIPRHGNSAICSLIKTGKKGHGNLYVGGQPINNSILGFGNHGQYISDLCEKTRKPLGLVVSVVEDYELESGAPGPFLKPMKPSDWRETVPGINVKQLPIQDRNSQANTKKLGRILKTIDTTIKSGKSVNIHCKAGRGRSAMVTALYLVTYGDMSLPQALQTVQQRNGVHFSKHRIKFIQGYLATYHKERANNIATWLNLDTPALPTKKQCDAEMKVNKLLKKYPSGFFHKRQHSKEVKQKVQQAQQNGGFKSVADLNRFVGLCQKADPNGTLIAYLSIAHATLPNSANINQSSHSMI